MDFNATFRFTPGYLHSRVERSRVSGSGNLKNPLKPLQKTCGLYLILAPLVNETLQTKRAQLHNMRYLLQQSAGTDKPTLSFRRAAASFNKSPEPTAVGACSSAIAVHVASRRWLSFFR